eukprot:gene16032-biopygen2865
MRTEWRIMIPQRELRMGKEGQPPRLESVAVVEAPARRARRAEGAERLPAAADYSLRALDAGAARGAGKWGAIDADSLPEHPETDAMSFRTSSDQRGDRLSQGVRLVGRAGGWRVSGSSWR